MKNLDDLTVVIVTYKTSEKVIFDCLKSIDSTVKILLIGKFQLFYHEKSILLNFPNVKIFCTGSNLGYGKGNNFGLNLVKSNNALIPILM